MKNKKNSEIDAQINQNPDFIDCPKFGNSLKIYLNSNYGKQASDGAIAKMLHLSDSDIEATYLSALKKIKDLIK
jgi:hypothetical protein